MKFKKGDKVKLISNNGPARYDRYVGKVFTIRDVHSTIRKTYYLEEIREYGAFANENELKLIKGDKMSKGTSLTQRAKALLRSKEDKALIKAGVVYASTGNLTSEGRKLVLNHIFQNDTAVKAAVVDVATKLVEEECKKTKTS